MLTFIANKEVVPEFLQSEMRPEKKTKLLELLDDKSSFRNQMLDDFIKIKGKLGTPGVYLRVASEILKATRK